MYDVEKCSAVLEDAAGFSLTRTPGCIWEHCRTSHLEISLSMLALISETDRRIRSGHERNY